MRSLALLQLQLGLLSQREVDDQAQSLSYEHGHGLDVRVEEVLVFVNALLDQLGALQFVGEGREDPCSEKHNDYYFALACGLGHIN